MNRLNWRSALLALFLSLTGCSDGPGPLDAGTDAQVPPDASDASTEPVDAWSTDAFVQDAFAPDAAAPPIEGLALPDPREADAWIRALAGLDLGRPEVLCLGENDHGVAESSLVQGHVIADLARRGRVSVVALEMPGAAADVFDAFVDDGDEARLMAALDRFGFALANSVELELFMRRMRDLDREVGGALRVEGYDIAVQLEASLEALAEFVERAAITSEQSARCLDTATADREVAAIGCEMLGAAMQEARAALEAAHGVRDTRRALRDARDLAAGHRFLAYYERGTFAYANAFREQAMVENIRELRARVPSDETLVLIAHNSHCAPGEVIALDRTTGADLLSLGSALRTELGAGYRVIAQLYLGGTHSSRATGRPEAYPDTSTTIEGALRELAPDAPAWLISTSSEVFPFHERAGTAWGGSRRPPAERWDDIVWLREVSATTLRF